MASTGEGPKEAESLVSRYLERTARLEGGRHSMKWDEVVWLIDHCTRIGAHRLELLRALQSALPRAEDEPAVSDLKDLLTDLIIMQSRLMGRDERLGELLHRLAGTTAIGGVSVDKEVLTASLLDILNASDRVNAAGATE